jgi:hypothetical protein
LSRRIVLPSSKGRCLAAEQVLHNHRSFAVHGRQDVGVGIERDPDAGMAEHLGDELRMDRALEPDRR